MNRHSLYNTGDSDAPEQIKDRNGEVVLQSCRKCGQAEADLQPECPGEGGPNPPYWWNGNGEVGSVKIYRDYAAYCNG